MIDSSEHGNELPDVALGLAHPTGRVLTSDWSIETFVMVVYENFFSHLRQPFKTIYGPVRSEYSSCRV